MYEQPGVVVGSTDFISVQGYVPGTKIPIGPAVGTVLSLLIIGAFIGYVCERYRARRQRRKYIQSARGI